MRVLLALSVVLTLLLLYSVVEEYGARWRRIQREYAGLIREQGGTPPKGGRIEQKIVAVNNRLLLDRCETCHQGIHNPNAAGFDQPLTTHPPMVDEAGEPIEGHDLKKLGCVSCHAGNGRGLAVEDAHGQHEHWLQPLRIGKWIQASCYQCHDTSAVDLAGAPDLAMGRRLFQEKACWACHTIEGASQGKVGPLLTAVGDRLSPDQIRRSIVDPTNGGRQPDSAMPRFDLSDDQVEGLTIFLAGQRRLRIIDQKIPTAIGRLATGVDPSAPEAEQGEALFAVRGCAGCHAVRTGPQSVLGARKCPELTYAGRMRGADYLKKHLESPKDDVADSIMPPFDFLPAAEREAVVAYLMTLSFEPAAAEGVDARGRARGQYRLLCASCHGETGNGLGPVAEAMDPKPKNFQKKGFVAAYASRFAERILSGVPGTAMPPWKEILSREEAEALVELIQRDFAKLGEGAQYVRESKPAPPPAAEPEVFEAYLRGREIFLVYCAGCHGRLGTGKGSNAYDLLGLGREGPGGDVQGEMLPRNLRNPKYYEGAGVLDRQRIYDSIRLGVPGTAMPPWDHGLSEAQVEDVMEFVLRANDASFQRRAKERKK
ncbi:MAG: c-type cytochrome [Planctomycetota bacterium]